MNERKWISIFVKKISLSLSARPSNYFINHTFCKTKRKKKWKKKKYSFTFSIWFVFYCVVFNDADDSNMHSLSCAVADKFFAKIARASNRCFSRDCVSLSLSLFLSPSACVCVWTRLEREWENKNKLFLSNRIVPYTSCLHM